MARIKNLRDGDYVLKDGTAWFTVKDKFSVKISATDDGIFADIYALGNETNEPIAECYAFDQEADEIIKGGENGKA